MSYFGCFVAITRLLPRTKVKETNLIIIRQTLSTCDSCQCNKITAKSPSVILESVQPEEPLELLSIDFFEPW